MRRKKLKLEDIYEIIESDSLKTPLYFRRVKGYSPKQYINGMYQISKWIAQIKEPTFVIAELALKDYYRFEVLKEYSAIYFSRALEAYALYDTKEDIVISCDMLSIKTKISHLNSRIYANVLNADEVKFLDLVFDKVNFLKQKQESAGRKEKAKVLREELIDIYKKELVID